MLVHVADKMDSVDVLEVIYPLIVKHVKPDFIRSDTDPEFVSETFQSWLRRVGIIPIRHLSWKPLGERFLTRDLTEACAMKF